MKLFVWRPFFRGMSSPGMAFAVAETVEEARRRVREYCHANPDDSLSFLRNFGETLEAELAPEPKVYDLPAAGVESGAS